MQGFIVGGFVAGLGGVLAGGMLSQVAASAFPIDSSINAAAILVVGGLGVFVGPLLGALYVIGIPQFLPLDNAGLAATSIGWLIVIVNFPGGISQAFGATRDRIADYLARRAGLDPASERAGAQGDAVSAREPSESTVFSAPLGLGLAPVTVGSGREVVLEAKALTKTFGGLAAVAGVSITVHRGETLGLIGPNGAGKTTLFELLSGFTRADSGQVLFEGQDITYYSPDWRARTGLIRSFQDAALFPTLTVVQCLMLAQERADPTRFLRSVAGLNAGERRKKQGANELVEKMGLEQYRNHQIRSLSTGTRRVVELACLIALAPTVLLLDEPTAGIAQHETEALGVLLGRLKEQMGLTLVVIEHDIPLIMSISDRIIAMESGRVLAEGSPNEVVEDADVIASYLGTDKIAIGRSEPKARVTAPSEGVV
jgi:ABC-type branched-subunit amino acid transport system ATPase component